MVQQAVTARGLGKVFGDVVALDGVDLDVAPGQVHGVVGPNGAGKSTLLGLLLGLAVRDTGTLEVLGTPLGRRLGAPTGVSGFVDGPGLYPRLTARQNLTALAALSGSRGTDGRAAERAEQADALLDRVGLLDVAGDAVRGFSLGMRQRLGLAAALLGSPRLLVLDEPANGLDPVGQRQVHQVLTDLADGGTAVVLSSHRMDDLAAVCDEVTVLGAARVAFSGPLARLTAQLGPIEHRLVTTDADAARVVAAHTPSVTVSAPAPRAGVDAGELVVRTDDAGLDRLVERLVRERIGVREIGPVVPPLEAAYLALAGAGR